MRPGLGTRKESFIYCGVLKNRGARLLAGVGLTSLAISAGSTATVLGSETPDDLPFGAGSLSPLLAQPSSDTSVTVGLTVAQTSPARPTLDLRGRSIGRDETEDYKVETRVPRIPCPGEYRFHAATEDTSNGNSSSYSALLRLFDPSVHPPGARCGGSPPPLPGQMRVLLQSRVDRLFLVQGARSNAGAFEGKLSLSSVPECNKNYTLEAALNLSGWSRSVEFKVQAIEINTTLQGRPAESKRC